MNPITELLPNLYEAVAFDSAEQKKTVMLITRQGGYIKLNHALYRLLVLVNEGQTFAQVAETLSQEQGRPMVAAQAEALYQSALNHIRQIDNQPVRNKLTWHIPLLPQRLVVWGARLLTFAYAPPVALLFLMFIACTFGLVLTQPSFFSLSFKVDEVGLIVLVMLSLFDTLAHEFGHASACVRYGATPKEIGFGVYFINPVFYSDVSDAWRLRRWQRVIVDLGGIYFQLLITAVYTLAFWLLGSDLLRAVVLLNLVSVAADLNPIYKFDGYWMVSDALGIANLSQQARHILATCMKRLRGQTTIALPWSRNILIFLACYGVVAIAFWGFILVNLVPHVWAILVHYPQNFLSLLAMTSFDLIRVQGFLIDTLFLITIAKMCLNLIMAVMRALQKRWLEAQYAPWIISLLHRLTLIKTLLAKLKPSAVINKESV